MMRYRIARMIDDGVARLTPARGRASRHDLVLAAIPAAMLLAAIVGVALSVPPATAAAAGATLSGPAVLDALFLNPPRGRSSGRPPA